MRRTAVYFGLWTAFCMLMSTATMFTVIDLWLGPTFSGLHRTLSTVGNVAPFCVPVGIVAGMGWWLLHRQGRQPDWPGYALFALAVVLVNHVLFFGFWMVLLFPAGFVAMAKELVVAFVLHGWLTVPVAFLGTYLFVRWNGRRATTTITTQ